MPDVESDISGINDIKHAFLFMLNNNSIMIDTNRRHFYLVQMESSVIDYIKSSISA